MNRVVYLLLIDMVAATASQPQPVEQPQPVRFWLSHSGAQERIRVEFVAPNGLLATNEASFDGVRLHWCYGQPPESVGRIARTAIEERAEYSIDGAEFAGWESWSEMDLAADDHRYDAWFKSQGAPWGVDLDNAEAA